MAQSWQETRRFWGVLVMGGAIASFSLPAVAQIVPDDTLGGERSQITRDVLIRGLRGDRIDGGALRGSNAFHSFREFNVNEGQRVYFSNPTGIENIFSRVTGSDVSDILGTLGVDGGANLFLLNPNGILFGPNAQLDISGSFVASTGDRFTFPDGSEFGATNPQAPPLYTVSVPLGVQFGSNRSGDITNQGSLTTGQDLTLSANTLDLQGQLQAGNNLTLSAQNTVRIRDSAIAPFIAAAGGQLLVQGDQAVDIFALSHPNSGLFSGGDLILRSATPVGGDAHYWSGGSFRVEQLDRMPGAMFSPNDPVVLAIGDVIMGDYSTGGSLHILAGGSVTLGNVDINAIAPPGNAISLTNPTYARFATVILSDETQLPPIDGSTQATLDVRAGIDWTSVPNGFPGNSTGGIVPPPTLQLPPPTGSTIAIASITGRTLTDSVVLLTNQYFADPLRPGDIRLTGINPLGNSLSVAGSVAIDATHDIQIAAGIDTSRNTATAGEMRLLSGGTIDTRGGTLTAASNMGDGGNIFLTARQGNIFTDAVSSSYVPLAPGGMGNGGNIILDANGTISTRDVQSFVGLGGTGNGGIVSMTSHAGAINTSTGTISLNTPNTAIGGSAGSIILSAFSDVTTAEIRAFVNDLGSGDGGIIFINSDTGIINTTAGGLVSSTSNGNGGFVTLTAAGDIRTAGIESLVGAGGTGVAGDITLDSGNTIDTTAGTLRSTTANGDGGPITLTAVGDIRTASIESFVGDGGRGTAGGIALISSAGMINTQQGTLLSSSNNNSVSGDITLRALGDITLGNVNAASVNDDPSRFNTIAIESTQGSIFLDGTTLTTTNTNSNGQAGLITLDASNQVSIINQSSIVSRGTNGQILIGRSTPPQVVNIIDNPQEGVSTDDRFGLITDGTDGDIEINALQQVQVTNSRISSRSNYGTVDPEIFSTIEINAPQGFIDLEQARVETTNSAPGLAGDISISALNQVRIQNGSTISSNGTFGRIFIGESISSSGVPIYADFSPQTIRINHSTLTTSNQTSEGVFGRAGDIQLTAGDRIVITNPPPSNLIGIFSETSGSESAGNISFLVPRGSIRLTGGFISARTALGVIGKGGEINVEARSLTMNGGAQLSTSTSGLGNAGNVTVQANTVSLRDSAIIFSTVESEAGSANQLVNGGTIDITANSLTMDSGAQLNTSTSGLGDAGDVTVQANTALLRDSATIFSTVEAGAGSSDQLVNGGTIAITADSLMMGSGAQLQTQVNGANLGVVTDPTDDIPAGQGNAGNVFLDVSDTISLDGNGTAIFSSLGLGARGRGGTIFTGDFRFSSSGDVTAIAPTQSLSLTDGGQLIASTAGRGRAGSVFAVADNVSLDGVSNEGFRSAIFSGVDSGAGRGSRGGNVLVVGRIAFPRSGTEFSPAHRFSISNGALVNVSSFGRGDLNDRGGQNSTLRRVAGDIRIYARNMTLNNDGRIVAETGIGNGGNIRIRGIDDYILLRHESGISTTAGRFRAPGTGGNITISANEGFLLGALNENSDIASNAYGGAGGRVNVTADGIVGLVFRSREDLERLLGTTNPDDLDPVFLPTNDITAISQTNPALNGEVRINAQDFDTRGISTLPVDLGDPSRLVVRNCPNDGGSVERLGEFVVTGRGGLPPNPADIVPAETVVSRLATLDAPDATTGAAAQPAANAIAPPANEPPTLIEAQGWVTGANGEVVFVAQTPNVTPYVPVLTPATCNAP